MLNRKAKLNASMEKYIPKYLFRHGEENSVIYKKLAALA